MGKKNAIRVERPVALAINSMLSVRTARIRHNVASGGVEEPGDTDSA